MEVIFLMESNASHGKPAFFLQAAYRRALASGFAVMCVRKNLRLGLSAIERLAEKPKRVRINLMPC